MSEPRYTPELIVRQIAADRIPRHALSGRCRYCAASKHEDHVELCVWRQAREWVIHEALRQAGAGL